MLRSLHGALGGIALGVFLACNIAGCGDDDGGTDGDGPPPRCGLPPGYDLFNVSGAQVSFRDADMTALVYGAVNDGEHFDLRDVGPDPLVAFSMEFLSSAAQPSASSTVDFVYTAPPTGPFDVAIYATEPAGGGAAQLRTAEVEVRDVQGGEPPFRLYNLSDAQIGVTAQFAGTQDPVGTLAPGAYADLVGDLADLPLTLTVTPPGGGPIQFAQVVAADVGGGNAANLYVTDRGGQAWGLFVHSERCPHPAPEPPDLVPGQCEVEGLVAK